MQKAFLHGIYLLQQLSSIMCWLQFVEAKILICVTLPHSLDVTSVIQVRNKQTAPLLFTQEITYYENNWVIIGIAMGTDDTAGWGIKGGGANYVI